MYANEFDLKSQSKFKMTYAQRECSKGQKVKTQKKTRIKTSTGDFSAFYGEKKIAEIKNLSFDFASENNSLLDLNVMVNILCWQHPENDRVFGCFQFMACRETGRGIRLVQRAIRIFFI
ncbi:hypothetical protein JYT72_02295 [Crocinitomix catalasitica]|nr:hypothetical protein [Crocinitomix catalasitica]